MLFFGRLDAEKGGPNSFTWSASATHNTRHAERGSDPTPGSDSVGDWPQVDGAGGSTWIFSIGPGKRAPKDDHLQHNPRQTMCSPP